AGARCSVGAVSCGSGCEWRHRTGHRRDAMERRARMWRHRPMGLSPGPGAMSASPPRRDHHDWASDAYVDEWVKRQQADDPTRAERFELICDLFPFPRDAKVTILDIGAGYAPLCRFILDRFPHATCIGQDNSAPMLNHARKLMARYGERFKIHHADLFDRTW